VISENSSHEFKAWVKSKPKSKPAFRVMEPNGPMGMVTKGVLGSSRLASNVAASNVNTSSMDWGMTATLAISPPKAISLYKTYMKHPSFCLPLFESHPQDGSCKSKAKGCRWSTFWFL
jgi:hypothetical protein